MYLVSKNQTTTGISKKVSDYFFQPVYNAYNLATLRIGLGLILIIQFFQIKPDIFKMIGEYGLIRQDITTASVPPYVITSTSIVHFLNTYFHLNELQSLNLLGIVYVSGLVLLVLGLLTRPAALLVWFLHLAFANSARFFVYGVDFFINMLLFYCIVFPVGREYSLDKIIFKLKSVNYTPYVRVLQLHICLVYFISGLAKAIGVNWWNGISIWKSINRPIINNFDIKMLAHFNWLFVAAGIGTLITEVLYPVFMNIPKTRKLWLIMTCVMHLVIAFVLQLPYFAAIMILFNVVSFSYPEKRLAAN